MNRLDQHQPLTSTITRFYEGDTISQVFYSHRNDLNTVSICLRNEGRALTPMTFTLSVGDKVVRTLQFSGGNIDNEDCTKFKFDKIEDSQNKTYVAAITSPPADKQAQKPAVFSIEMHEGVMHFKTFYYQAVSAVAQESIAQLTSRFTQDPVFLILWVLMVGYLINRLRLSKRDR